MCASYEPATVPGARDTAVNTTGVVKKSLLRDWTMTTTAKEKSKGKAVKNNLEKKSQFKNFKKSRNVGDLIICNKGI